MIKQIKDKELIKIMNDVDICKNFIADIDMSKIKNKKELFKECERIFDFPNNQKGVNNFDWLMDSLTDLSWLVDDFVEFVFIIRNLDTSELASESKIYFKDVIEYVDFYWNKEVIKVTDASLYRNTKIYYA